MCWTTVRIFADYRGSFYSENNILFYSILVRNVRLAYFTTFDMTLIKLSARCRSPPLVTAKVRYGRKNLIGMLLYEYLQNVAFEMTANVLPDYILLKFRFHGICFNDSHWPFICSTGIYFSLSWIPTLLIKNLNTAFKIIHLRNKQCLK